MVFRQLSCLLQSGWPQSPFGAKDDLELPHPSVFASQVLGLQACATLPSLWGAGDQIQASMYGRRALYHLSYTSGFWQPYWHNVVANPERKASIRSRQAFQIILTSLVFLNLWPWLGRTLGSPTCYISALPLNYSPQPMGVVLIRLVMGVEVGG